MADSITEGFGATPPVQVDASLGSTLVRIIAAPPGVVAQITMIKVAAIRRNVGAPDPTLIPVAVLRGGYGLAVDGSGTLRIPSELRFFDPGAFGMPSPRQIGGSLEFLAGDYIRYQNQEIPLVYKNDDLIAADNKKLAVVISPAIDDTGAPAMIDLVNVSLTVTGTYKNLSTRPLLGGTGRSMPRYG